MQFTMHLHIPLQKQPLALSNTSVPKFEVVIYKEEGGRGGREGKGGVIYKYIDCSRNL